tara:strand:+ start:131 stop:595 length:465 start_codon:yes stop_codon:yes gene_type:complete
MALSIKVQSNIKIVQSKYIKFINKFPQIIKMGLDQAGENLKTIVVDRTHKRGLDMNNRKFIGYSSYYQELKGKTKVDLQDTNRMLQSIGSKLVSSTKAQVFFRSQREAIKAFRHQTGQGKLPVRKFFGFNKKVEKLIGKNYERFINKQIKKFKI